MSTQSASATEFFVLPEESQPQFRLLELPPELLEILTSTDAKPIHFKSSPNAASNLSLCTPTQTYTVRQVNTSNSVYITRPHATATTNNGPTAPSIHAIAKSDFTYELAPTKTTLDTVIPYIRAALPIYTSTGAHQLKPDLAPKTKADLFADIPFSDLECERGWKRLACFELDDDDNNAKGCFIPSGEAKLQAWKSTVQRSHEYGIDLTAAFNESLLIDSSSDLARKLSQAILSSVAVDTSASQLDASETVRQAGLWNLEAATQTRGAVKMAEFVGEWKDLLPEKWREMARLEELKGEYEVVNEGREIRLAASASGGSSSAVGEKAGPAAEAKSLGAKRKWHEKFRVSKKGA
ncbi:hypothetical protein EJ03DRAFT_355359 [Teratosphaeria nubilosa]|uniref:Sister chromatid cohesion protein Dcc1 n=1 Tax=Teratosphaeria nubilosa TaxID=161662 RepID=A0A6G1KWB7_9PEZI|nr:hypothetical protein EJ03DRAFT_355359 [Teratosphaeria nubilosa]